MGSAVIRLNRRTLCTQFVSAHTERRLLAAVPLHAITVCYGEDGLRSGC